MAQDDTYKTIRAEASYELKIERSVFIAHAREVNSEEEAKAFIAAIREEHKQATHNCYAYRIGTGSREITYFNDHGEPSGTAGKPILGAILSREATNLCVVVTRYFGGKKLGVRGLIEAYGAVAGKVIDTAGIVAKAPTSKISIECDYPNLDRVLYQLNQYGATVITADYGQQILLTVEVNKAASGGLSDSLRSLAQVRLKN
ncbi:MAG: IMPACT family protein [Syntrophothermus sp.]